MDPARFLRITSAGNGTSDYDDSSPLGWAYQPGHGVWEPCTMTLKFCELEYYVTPYIAEFTNTLTNLTYLFLAYYGLRNAIRNKQDSSILITYASLIGVGLSSIATHGTLKYPCQVVDELAMIYTTAMALFSVFGILLGTKGRTILGACLTTLVLSVTLGHLYAEESTMHQICFGLMIAGVGFKCRYLMRYVVKDKMAWESMVNLAILGSVTFVGGYGLWLIDVHACSTLQSWRRSIGMPFGFLLELHGWWHIFTAIGAYSYLVFVEYLRDVIQKESGKEYRGLKLHWLGGVIPGLHAVKNHKEANGFVTMNGNGIANGHTKAE